MERWTFVFLAWLVAVISTLGSLFFSEVMHFPPCVLCWYQRICMYPLVVILLTGLFPFEPKIVRFALPLSFIGLVIAIYHNLLYYKILPESAAPCVQGISCTTVQIEWFGFITIPFLSLMGFLLVSYFLFLASRMSRHEK